MSIRCSQNESKCAPGTEWWRADTLKWAAYANGLLSAPTLTPAQRRQLERYLALYELEADRLARQIREAGD